MWIAFSILSALADAVRNVLNKHLSSKFDVDAINLGIFIFSLPLYLIFLFFQDVPPIGDGFWSMFALHIALEFCATVALTHALKNGELSLVTPLLGFSSIIVVLTSSIFFNENYTMPGVVGTLMNIVGIYLLGVSQSAIHPWKPFITILKKNYYLMALLVAVLWAFDGQVLKVAVQKSSIFFLLAVSASVLAALFLAKLALKGRSNEVRKIFAAPLRFIVLGLAAAGSLSFMLIAFKMPGGLIAYVLSVKRLSLLFGTIAGGLVFNERNRRSRLVGAVIICAGVIIITLWG